MNTSVTKTVVWASAWLASAGLAFLLGRATGTLIKASNVEYAASIEPSQPAGRDLSNESPQGTTSEDLDIAEETTLNETLILAEKVALFSTADLAKEFKRLVEEEEINHLKLNFVIHEWAGRDPEAALETILEPGHKKLINLTSAALMAVWAKQDPLRAYEVYRDYLAQEKVYGAAKFAFYGLASVNPEQAFREIQNYDNYLNQNHNRLDGIKEALVRHYTLPQALKMIDSASSENTPLPIRGGVIRSWIRSEFDYTVETLWQMDQINEDSSTGIGENTRSIVFEGLYYDLERTLAWTLKRDRIDDTDALTRYALRHLTINMKRPEDVRAWVETQLSAEERERYLDILETEENQ